MPTKATTTAKMAENPAIEAETPKKAVKKTEMTVKSAPAPALNIREKPNGNAKVIGEIPDGAKIEVQKASAGWYKVDSGYVMAKYLV